MKGHYHSQYDEDLEKLEATRAEKVLALTLVFFLLIGGFWILKQLEGIPPAPDYEALTNRFGLNEIQAKVTTIQWDLTTAEELWNKKQAKLNEARAEYEFRREEYRTSLDSGVNSPVKEQAYRISLQTFEELQLEATVAKKLVDAKREQMQGPEEELRDREVEFSKAFETANKRYQLYQFLLRFGYAAPAFGLATYIWIRLRKKRNRYMVIGTALLAFTGIQLLFVAGIYAWTLLRDLAQIAVSLVGSAISIAGLVALKRFFFKFERIARTRIRRGQCPFCGFPAEHGNAFCRECGQALGEQCPVCPATKPVFSPYCPSCGAGSSNSTG